APTPELERLSSARRTLFGLAGPAKRHALAGLARAEAALARDLFRTAAAALERRAAELIAAAKDRDLFGRRRGLTPDERALLRRLRASWRELRAAAVRLEREGGAPFFAFESHFGDVLAQGGFDLVAGNPPWVRGERVPVRVREALATRYATWRPARGRGFAHLPDLAVAFVERALELAAPGGAAALLVPAKLVSSGYAEPLRRRLAEGARIERVAPLPAAGSAFAAAVYPMVLVTTRAEPTGREQVATALGAKSATPLIPQRALAGDGPWILVRDAMRVARHLGARCARVGERWRPQLGVKTGADEVFLSPQPGPATRPAVRGRDLAPWRATPRIHLFWTHAPDGRPLARLPPELAAVLAPHLERLGRRSDCRNGPPWQLFRTALAYAPCRVIWPDLARRLAAVVPDPEIVPLIAVRWPPPRILSEHLGPLPEPLACLLTPGPIDAPAAVAALGARALLDLAPLGSEGRASWPAWLAPHQVPAAERLRALLTRHGGALLADAPGLGKSYVALAVALAVGEPFALVVPAVLVDQWRALLARFDTNAPMITH